MKFFDSITGGWVGYKHNLVLVQVFSHALISTGRGHESALVSLKRDVMAQKKNRSGIDMRTPSLFDDQAGEANLKFALPVRTEGIKYAGSKNKLIPQILSLASKIQAHSVLDGFAGTTRVSQAFAQSGYSVISNDISTWSEVFGTCYLLNSEPRSKYYDLIKHLNSLKPTDGWFTENYGGDPNQGSSIGADGLKKPWQKHNTRKLDAIRLEIDRLSLTKIQRASANEPN